MDSLKLAHFVYSAAEQFSINIQAKDITVLEASNGAILLIKYLKSFYEQVLKELSLTDYQDHESYQKEFMMVQVVTNIILPMTKSSCIL